MPVKRHRIGDIDWGKIQTEYITGKSSYRALAEKYEVGQTALDKHARAEHWSESRKEYRRNVVKRAVERVGKKESGKLEKMIVSADLMLEQVYNALSDSKQFNRYIVNGLTTVADGDGEETVAKKVEAVFLKADTKSMLEMASTLKTLADVIRNVNEISTAAEIEARNLAIQKLELERERINGGKDDNMQVTVKFEENTKEFSE